MNYLEISFHFGDTIDAEILLAEISEVAFESFVESKGVLKAYIPKNQFNDQDLAAVQFLKNKQIEIEVKEIQQVNWNEEWEKSFEPIVVDQRCIVKADFHENEKEYEYNIIVTPKMAFGTGHHATTHLMLSYMLQMEFQKKRVLDMGTGTGVLAILAALRGAKSVLAIDYDEWAVDNAIENVAVNACDDKIEVRHGDSSCLNGETFDVLLANINKNVIKADFDIYYGILQAGGIMLLSGVLTDDIADVLELANSKNMEKHYLASRDKWSILVFSKKS